MHVYCLFIVGVPFYALNHFPLTNNELHTKMIKGCPGADCELLRNIKQHPFFFSYANGPDKDDAALDGLDPGVGLLTFQIVSPSHWPFRLHSDENEFCTSNMAKNLSGDPIDGQEAGSEHCLGISSLSIYLRSKNPNDTDHPQFGPYEETWDGNALKKNPADWWDPSVWAMDFNELIRGTENSNNHLNSTVTFEVPHDLTWVQKNLQDTYILSCYDSDLSNYVHFVELTKNSFTKKVNGKPERDDYHKNPFDRGQVGSFLYINSNSGSSIRQNVSGHSVKELLLSYALVVLAYAHPDSPIKDEKLAAIAIQEFDSISRANPYLGNDSNLVFGSEVWPAIGSVFFNSTNDIFKFRQAILSRKAK